MKQNSRGFSLIEILISIGIIAALAMIGTYAFGDNLKNKEVTVITDDIISKLELARSNAITGKNGTTHGIKFNDDSYIEFSGSTYISSNENNNIHTISNKYTISNNIPGADDKIVFSKIKGESNHAGAVTITIGETNGPLQKQVIIGPLGDVTMVK